jgi:energy-converting hydrogenase Eha subunit B
MVPFPWLIAHEAKALVASGAVTARERRRFVAGFAFVVYTLTGVQVWFALTTHNRNPLCEGPGAAGTVVNVVVTVLLVVGLGWLWLSDGAAFLARFAPVFLNRRKTYTARQVWWVVGAIALFLVVPVPMGRKGHRSVQTTLCTEQRRMPDPVEQLRWWLWQNRREG